MSNERIDLTQFEGIPKRMETVWHEHPIYGARHLIKICEPETPWVVGAVVPDFEPSGDYGKDKVEQEKMAKMFAAVPELIAELKRCYEEIDRVRAIAEDLHAYIVSNADISLSVAEKQMDWVDASE